jgi:hypothetical protein
MKRLSTLSCGMPMSVIVRRVDVKEAWCAWMPVFLDIGAPRRLRRVSARASKDPPFLSAGVGDGDVNDSDW